MPCNNIVWSRITTPLPSVNNTSLTASRPCPVCDANNPDTRLLLKSFQFFTDSNVTDKQTDVITVQCKSCGALYMNPVYTRAGFSILFAEAAASYGSSEGRPIEQAQWLADKEDLSTGRSIIDLGCHHGEFLATLPDHLQRTGIDIDREIINTASRKNIDKNIQFYASAFTGELPLQPNSIITMLHVLEHLPNPKATLVNLQQQSTPQTRLFIEVPLLEKGHTNDINGFLSVTHLTHFSRSSLRNCINNAGWKILHWDEQQDYNGCRVIAMPDNDRTSMEQPYNDSVEHEIKECQHYLAHWQQAVRNVVEKIDRLRDSQHCIIWGAGLHTEFLYQLTPLFNANPAQQFILIDSDQQKQGKTWRGISIFSPEALLNSDLGNTPIVISTYRNQEAVAKQIIKLTGNNANIVRLYEHIRSY